NASAAQRAADGTPGGSTPCTNSLLEAMFGVSAETTLITPTAAAAAPSRASGRRPRRRISGQGTRDFGRRTDRRNRRPRPVVLSSCEQLLGYRTDAGASDHAGDLGGDSGTTMGCAAVCGGGPRARALGGAARPLPSLA